MTDYLVAGLKKLLLFYGDTFDIYLFIAVLNIYYLAILKTLL